jgi:hypothetical protein
MRGFVISTGLGGLTRRFWDVFEENSFLAGYVVERTGLIWVSCARSMGHTSGLKPLTFLESVRPKAKALGYLKAERRLLKGNELRSG